MSQVPTEKLITNSSVFRSSLRAGVALILVLLGTGQIVGRLFSINSTNTLTYEQTVRSDLQEELKYLSVVASEEGKAEEAEVYNEFLKREFLFDASKLQSADAAKAAKDAKAKAARRWPIQARRDNWVSRGKALDTASLVKKVVGETKFRREDLVAELKYLSVVASESNQPEEQAVYEQAIPPVLKAIADEENQKIKKQRPDVLESELKTPDPFDPNSLRDPKIVEQVKAAKASATHHWPIAIRRQDIERFQQPWSTRDLLEAVVAEVNKQRPFLSGNDRSRWLTVRSLVEFGTFEIDQIMKNEPAWDSVDVVSHMNSSGEQRLYSSKPPMQAVLVAGPYWLLNKATGWTLGTHPFEVGRILLLLINIVPLGIAWWYCARLLDAWCDDDLAYVGLMSCVCFATLLSTFAVAFNNHLWGAVSAIAATWHATRCWQNRESRWHFIGAGFWAAFAFTCELPAASLLGMLGLLLLWHAPRPTLQWGAPAVLLVLLAYFGTNYIAHGRWSPPYSFGAGDVNTVDSKQRENWYDYDYIRGFDGKKVDSYWRKPDNPLDQGEASTSHYLIHATVGHHGIVSLTPVLILAIPGMLLGFWSPRLEQRRWVAATTVTSIACLVFYLFLLDTRQRNYGGTTSAFRQLMWLHPLWLLASVPAVERLIRFRWGIGLVSLLAGLSMVSVSYPTWNPWTQTWIWNLMLWLGISPMSQS